jgi:hypothetical protein
MFNLNQAISEWRKKMAEGGIKTSAILDELESHLREDVERKAQAGTDAETAFIDAMKKIGSPGELKNA